MPVQQQTRKTPDGPPAGVAFGHIARLASVDPQKINAETRSVEVVWSTGAAVDRRQFDWESWTYINFTEELDLSAEAVDMSRLASGAAPVLDTHQYWSVRQDQVGVVDKAWIADGEGRATLRFSKRADVDGLWNDVQSGIVRNVSVGYDVSQWEIVREAGKNDRYIARRWQPKEISFVPIGADADAGTRGEDGRITRNRPAHIVTAEIINRANAQTTETNMPMPATAAAGAIPAETEETRAMPETETAPRTEQTPAAPAAPAGWAARDMEKLQRRAAAFGLSGGQAIDAMRAHTSLDAATDALQELAAQRSAQTTQRAPHVAGGLDEREKRGAAMSNALLHRAAPAATKLDPAAHEFRGLSLIDMARDQLEYEGVKTRGLSRHEIAARALNLGTTVSGSFTRDGAVGMGTSDFPLILANTANKRLQDVYGAAPSLWKSFCRQSNASDFKTRYINRLSEAPRLEKVPEHAEFKRGALSEEGESYALSTYGKIIGITRQTLINDDLGAFNRLPMMFGQAAADNEADIVWGIVTANANMADGNALFSAAHGNTGTAGAPSVTTLGEARQKMRVQKGLAKAQFLNIQPSYIMVPTTLETLLDQILSQNMLATLASNITPEFIRSLTPIVEPRLDAASLTSWYLAADPARIDTIEYAYLEGQAGLYTETRMGFEVDGVELKVRQDFAAKSIDWRGLFKNAG